MLEISHYINGKTYAGNSQQYFHSINPATEEPLAVVQAATEEDVAIAILAAREAFDHGPWKRMTVQERGAYLHAIADAMQARLAELASLESQDTGLVHTLCLYGALPRAIEHFRFFAEEGKRIFGKCVPVGNSYWNVSIPTPLGVIGIVTPWNAPMTVSTINLAAALISGNTCVIKPSEVAPVTTAILGEIFTQVGLPPGVVNIVQGPGQPCGSALIKSKLIDGVCFVGGTDIGKEVLRYSANTVRRTLLELGGKSPTVILADADLEKAVDGAMLSCFSSNGQVCIAGSRIIIEAAAYDQFVESLVHRTNNMKVGAPQNLETEMGPLVSRQHLQHVMGYIERAKQDGVQLACGGVRPPEFDKGFYLRPTVFTGVDNKYAMAQEEIFGPVVCVIKANNAEHAIEIANDTSMGLAGMVWSRDLSKAIHYARQIKAGTVGVNSTVIRDIRSPFGGMKESGIGMIGGEWSIAQYTNWQTICLPIEPYAFPRYGL
ncbi:aldehyde dehydrogenase family protein [Massilia sp. W12]|uniref:aldehyde dehydrogenase family protein n=1 Tax=Massilia sp. W12 TaxID=3126507 RepID=UPI0030CDC201